MIPATDGPPVRISRAQVVRLIAIQNERGIAEADLKGYLWARYRIASRAHILAGDYDRVVEWLQGRRRWPGARLGRPPQRPENGSADSGARE